MCCLSTNSPEGSCTGFPDVCKTVVGPDVVPIPYPNEADVSDADPGTVADTILVCGFPAAYVETVIMLSQGDDTGELGGVVSETDMGPGKYVIGSETVMLEGIPAVFMGSMIGLNGMAEGNCPDGLQDTPSQESVLVAP